VSFVLDASMALAWCLDDEADARADAVLARIGSEDAITSAVWPLEVANGLRSAERRGRIDEGELPAARQLLVALPIQVEELPLARALADVLPLARALAISAYDASYVDLALRHGVPLATLDEQLTRAAAAAGARLLEP
jgi:predicted nucleic acid-binding protein